MILTIYIVFTALSLILLIIGQLFDEGVFKMIAFAFMFLIHSALLVQGIDYHSGDFINETSATETMVEMQYSNYNNHTIFFFMTVLSVVGFSLLLLNWKRNKDLAKDND